MTCVRFPNADILVRSDMVNLVENVSVDTVKCDCAWRSLEDFHAVLIAGSVSSAEFPRPRINNG